MSPIYRILQKYLCIIIAVQIICLSLFNTIGLPDSTGKAVISNYSTGSAHNKIPVKKPFHPGQLIHKVVNFHPYTFSNSELLPELYAVRTIQYPSSLASIVLFSSYDINLPPPKS
jgi:hypothetical protein